MTTFLKPENALKRAEELIAVGKKQDALDTLHTTIQNRRFRNLWTTTSEEIMMKHLSLCVDLGKMRVARDGLILYRTMCQAANIGSLEAVVQKFRKCGEEKVATARKTAEDLKLNELEDLDEMESPEQVLAKSIQAADTRQQSLDRDVHQHFRFLWDSYKAILDILKTNARLEDGYHQTARLAMDFCQSNERPQEFKRLCEMLRNNWQQLFKRTGQIPAHLVNPKSPETIQRTLETRCKQLQVSISLELWREAYITSEDVHQMMVKTKPKPHLRSQYYDFLGQIFWKSDNYLFHAFACMKNYIFVKTTKVHLTPGEEKLLASKSVLATLCIPFQKQTNLHSTLELATDVHYEKQSRMTKLFNVEIVPTRDSILSTTEEKQILKQSAAPCQGLFALIESDFTPLSLCQDAKPFLDELENPELCEGKLAMYATQLKQIIFFRLIKQLSQVYASMTIPHFEKMASIVPFSIAEKWMANAAKQQGINIQINYSQQAIVFIHRQKVDMKAMRQPLMEIGFKLQQVMQKVNPGEQQKSEKLEKQQLTTNIERRIEEEHQLIQQRKDEIERRKEASERRKEIEEREALEKIRKLEAREAEAERIRREEERKKREADKEEQKRKEQEMAKNKELLQQIKKQEGASEKVKVGGKKIKEIQEEDLEKIGLESIEKARHEQVQRERAEKIRQRKLETKRVDHLARALREGDRDKMVEFAQAQEKKDREFIQEAKSRQNEEAKSKHSELLKEKQALVTYQTLQQKWKKEQMKERNADYDKKMEERYERVMQVLVSNKVERARGRYEREQQTRKREMEKREREEQEEAQRQKKIEEEREEEERREQQKAEREKLAEERRKKRAEEEEAANRVAEKQRAREREIEERQQEERRERQPRGGGGGGDEGGWRDRDRGGGGGRDDWRNRGDKNDDGPPRGGRGGDSRDDWRRRGDDDGPQRGGRDDDRGPRGGGGKGRDRDDRGPRGGDRDDRGPRRDQDDDRFSNLRSGGGRNDRKRDDDDDGGNWRRDGPGRDPPRRRDDEEEGGWRRGGGRDEGGDDRRGGKGGGRRDDDREGGGQPWRRGQPRKDEDGDGGEWRRGGGRDEKKEDDGPSWRRDAPAKREEKEDTGEKKVPPWKRQQAGPPVEEPPPPKEEKKEAEADDDGFQAVTAGRKKKR